MLSSCATFLSEEDIDLGCTKKKRTAKCLYLQALCGSFDYNFDGYNFKRSIFNLLVSIDEWTYLLSVMLTLVCPRISLSVFISKPSSMHRVAKVCRRA